MHCIFLVVPPYIKSAVYRNAESRNFLAQVIEAININDAYSANMHTTSFSRIAEQIEDGYLVSTSENIINDVQQLTNSEIFCQAPSVLAYLQLTEELNKKTLKIRVFRISLSYKMLWNLVSCHFSTALLYFVKNILVGPQTLYFQDSIACKYRAQIIQTAR